MDRGASWATAHRVAKSRTRLKQPTMHAYILYCLSWACGDRHLGLSDLKNRHVSHSFGAGKSKPRLVAEGCLPGLQVAVFSVLTGEEGSSGFSSNDTNCIMEVHSQGLLSSQVPHLQIQSHWGLGLYI